MPSFHARTNVPGMPTDTYLYTVVDAADEAEAHTAFHSVFHGIGAGDVAILASPLAPVGTLAPYAGSTAPMGWLLCDGAAVSRTTYADLFAVIGEDYGAGDGSTTFNLPNHSTPIDYQQNATSPALGDIITVPAAVIERRIYGDLSMSAGATTSCSVNIERETGVGTDVYEIIMRERLPSGLSNTQSRPFTFYVPGGRKYRFVRDEAGGSAVVDNYNYDDIHNYPSNIQSTTIIKT